ncbi:MAG: hypothetical protein NZ902_01505 [Acidilobaceae archaeon]|nr:hypothetical protein [Acidilobaceae archaeon]MDW7973927.1 hypothetical protein [Sulfolobales archaeon]
MEEKVVLKVELSREEYEALKAKARSEGYPLPSEYAREVLRRALGKGEARGLDVKEIADNVSKRVERTVADLLNPYTGKIDEISRRLSELIELLEVEKEREAKEVKEPRELKERRPVSAIDRLKDQQVVFSEDMKWMKAPEKFFEKLRREGAMVVEVGEEKIAVDKDFWEQFKAEVESISVRSVEEASSLIGSYLGEGAGRLFKKLARAGLLVYDEDRGEWLLRVQGMGPASG